jgi:hypothetical protein
VLNWCRGGCRATHLTDPKAVEVTCRIKQEIIPFLSREAETQERINEKHCYQSNNYSTENNSLGKHITDYIQNLKKEETKLVETPDLPD